MLYSNKSQGFSSITLKRKQMPVVVTGQFGQSKYLKLRQMLVPTYFHFTIVLLNVTVATQIVSVKFKDSPHELIGQLPILLPVFRNQFKSVDQKV